MAAPKAALGETRAAACAELPQLAGLGGKLVVRKTFVHVQDHEEEAGLFRNSSAPALLLPQAGLEVPSGEPPSSLGAEWRTTVMFRNVPYLFTRDMFVELLNSQGFRGQFDLVYVPMDFKTNQTLGYAFANAISVEVAIRFFDVFEGFQAWPKKSAKVCSVCWSSRQGLESNVDVYRNLSVMQPFFPEAWKPTLFAQGHQVPFPAPTRKLERGRERHRGAGGAAPRI